MFIPIRPAGDTLPVQNPWVNANTPQPPLYQRCANRAFGPAAIKHEPVVALLNSLIATAT